MSREGVLPSRRDILTGGACAAAAAGWPTIAAAAARRANLAFEVWRNGHEIGRHTVAFDETAKGLVAHIQAELAVHVGPIPVFRYHHQAIETWRDGRFASLESHTVSNGKREQVSAKATLAGVRLIDAKGRAVTAAAETVPLTHWNMEVLRRPLFNPQTGALIKAGVSLRAGDSATLADGRAIPATRFTLAGDAQIVDWYDASDVWAALRGKVQDGSYVEYRRRSA